MTPHTLYTHSIIRPVSTYLAGGVEGRVTAASVFSGKTNQDISTAVLLLWHVLNVTTARTLLGNGKDSGPAAEAAKEQGYIELNFVQGTHAFVLHIEALCLKRK